MNFLHKKINCNLFVFEHEVYERTHQHSYLSVLLMAQRAVKNQLFE